MGRTFLPDTDGGLLAWSHNMSEQLATGAGPLGVSQELAEAFIAAAEAYATALGASQPAARSRATTRVKDEAKALLRAVAASVSKVVQGNPAVTSEQKMRIGLTVPKARSTIPPPRDAPFLQVLSVRGNTLRVRAYERPDKRAKPEGVASLHVYTRVVDGPGDGVGKFLMATGQTTFDVSFDATLPTGTTVWIAARWANPRQQAGPMSRPESVRLHGDLDFIGGGTQGDRRAA
jgi:hypothetical protein